MRSPPRGPVSGMTKMPADRAKCAPDILFRPLFLSAVLALALTLLLYGRALSLPLFSDDLVQVPWLESISWQELWTSTSPYGYYRPMWYSLWRLWGGLLGGLDSPNLHALNLIAHFAAAVLVGALAARWLRRDSGETSSRVAAVVATTLFAAFPFARQAIAWPGAVYNPIVAALAAGAVLSYEQGRRTGQARWPILAAILCLLAAFHYEAGLLAAPLVLIVELVGRVSRRWAIRRSWWPFGFLTLFLATFAFWLHMRGGGTATFGLQAEDLRRNAGFVVQGLVYPVAPLAQLLASAARLDRELCLWLVALPSAGLLVWAGLRSQRDALFLALGWIALFSLPPLVSMQADWFELAPRFLYTTAPGIALAWAAALVPLVLGLRSRWQATLASVTALALLLPAAAFVLHGVALYSLAGEAIWDSAQAAESARPLLLVNLPMRLTPHNRLYPLGFEGVTPLPQRVTGADIVYVHAGIADAGEAVSFGVVATDNPATYSYELLGPLLDWDQLAPAIRRNRSAFIARYDDERIHLVEAGGTVDEGRETEAVADFEGQVQLLSTESACDLSGQLHLTVLWRVASPVEADVTVFAHLLDGSGSLAAQADGYPLLGMLPFWLWQPGETMRDCRGFGPLTPGEYTIVLGLWEPVTGERWAVQGSDEEVVSLSVSCPQHHR